MIQIDLNCLKGQYKLDFAADQNQGGRFIDQQIKSSVHQLPGSER